MNAWVAHEELKRPPNPAVEGTLRGTTMEILMALEKRNQARTNF